jgi:hypothetical protein
MTSAERWLKASWPSARWMSSIEYFSSTSSGAGATSSTNSTSFGRREAWRKRCRQTLCAIAISQFFGVSGRSPRWNARYAFMNVVCVTSSASSGLRRTARA